MRERTRGVSVVVPTHRRPELIGRAVDSVLAQTVPPVEILVVDDDGDPETRRVVEERDAEAAVAVRYLHNPAANGPSGSRNLGAARAVGSVLAFLDDDDLWDPGYLEQAIGQLRYADVVLTPLTTVRFGHSGREVLREVREISLRSPAGQMIAHNPGVTGSNIVVGRALFLRCQGYDEDLWIGEDNVLLARLLESGARIRVADVSLATQVAHAGQRLSRGGRRRVEGYRNLVRKLYVTASPSARRRLAFGYFNARKDAAVDGWTRLRHRVYAWSLAEPRELGRRATWRAAVVRESVRATRPGCRPRRRVGAAPRWFARSSDGQNADLTFRVDRVTQ